jgi:hypothetical protein
VRLGRLNSRNTAAAAAASGGATMAPKAMAAVKGNPASAAPAQATGRGQQYQDDRERNQRHPDAQQFSRRHVECRIQHRRRHEQSQGELRLDTQVRRKGENCHAAAHQGQ